MKKISILLLLTCLFLKANAQETGLGLTEGEIKSLFDMYSFTPGYSDGQKFIATTQDYGQFYYFFDAKGICIFCTYVPNSTKDLSDAVSIYNQTCIILDKTHWKEIIKGKTYFISLITSNGYTFFKYSSTYLN